MYLHIYRLLESDFSVLQKRRSEFLSLRAGSSEDPGYLKNELRMFRKHASKEIHSCLDVVKLPADFHCTGTEDAHDTFRGGDDKVDPRFNSTSSANSFMFKELPPFRTLTL